MKGLNKVTLIGKIAKPFEFSHTVCDTNIYSTILSVERNSGMQDYIPIEVKENLIKPLKVGTKVKLEGEIRAYTYKGHLKVVILAYSIFETEPMHDENTIEIIGRVCKEPLFKITPKGKKICEILISVPRGINKKSYIPCILWSSNAEFASYLAIGTQINVEGRIQSRDYEKEIDGKIIQKTAYEVSCDSIALI